MSVLVPFLQVFCLKCMDNNHQYSIGGLLDSSNQQLESKFLMSAPGIFYHMVGDIYENIITLYGITSFKNYMYIHVLIYA